MILDKEQWTRFVDGFYVVGGAIGFDNTRYCFILEEATENFHRDPLPTLRLLFARMERPLERRFYRCDFENFNFTYVAFNQLNHEFVAVDIHGNVISYIQHEEKIDLKVEDPGVVTTWLEGERRAGITRLKCVNGKMYAIALDRFLLERKGPSQWKEFPGLDRPQERLQEKTFPLNFGFRDMDAFGESDIYAVGGKEVWHHDGNVWRKCLFPGNEWLETVCCAGDGVVYITGNMGSLWEGRGDQWVKLSDAAYTVPFNDCVWFAGKVWLSNDYALYTLENKKIIQADVEPDIQLTCRRLNISPDKTRMLSVGNHGASVFDGKQWEVLWNDLSL